MFADPAAPRGDALRKTRVLGRIDHVDPPGHHGDCARDGFKCRFMRGGIDPPGEAGNHGKPALTDPLSKPTRHSCPEGRGIARADQADSGAVQQRRVAQRPKNGRGIGQVDQRLRVVRRSVMKKPRPGGVTGAKFGFDDRRGTGFIVVHPRGPGNPRQGRKGGGGRSVFRQQPVKGDRAHPTGPQKAQSVKSVRPVVLPLKLRCGHDPRPQIP